MNSGIYVIFSLAQNKCYFGQTINFKKRKLTHIYNLKANRHPNNYLQHAWNKYGENSFAFYLICPCPKEDLNMLEVVYIKTFDSLAPKGFNMSEGGNHEKKTPEVYLKISKSRQGMKFSLRHRLNLSKANSGSRHPLFGKKAPDYLMNSIVKEYTFLSPSKEIVKIRNLRAFCREHNLTSSSMFRVASGKLKKHKQWTLP